MKKQFNMLKQFSVCWSWAEAIQYEQFEILRLLFFFSSFKLNSDGSNSRNSESILSALVQYFCENQNKIILKCLSSVKLESSLIYLKVINLIEGYSMGKFS